MTITDTVTIILLIIVGVVVSAAFCLLFDIADIAIYDADKQHSKRIAKYINKGNLYKAVRLYKKHNPAFFFTKYVKEYATDSFEGFVRTLYTYVKNENSTANVVAQGNLISFIEYITGKAIWKPYQRDINFHTYLQEKIDIMKNSDDVLDNKKWCAESDNISMCLFILALENTGFLKVKDGKKIDFKSLAIQRYNKYYKYYNMSAYKELYNIMDDCEVKDIITKVLNYDKYEED